MAYMLITWQVECFATSTLRLTAQGMTKFKDRDDDGYELILGELRRWVKGLQPNGIVSALTINLETL